MLGQPDRAPTGGFARSTNTHNNATSSFCDWLEAGTFVEGEITYPDVVSFLLQNNVYETEDFAWEFLGDVQTELRRRGELLGPAYPFDHVPSARLTFRGDEGVEPYLFCLTMSLPFHFKTWARGFVPKAGLHRTLFERLSAEACIRLFANWTVTNFAWSAGNAIPKGEIVPRVADILHGQVKDLSVFEDANDGGVDLLCHLPFGDTWGGYPAIVLQCASGITNYKGKVVEPNLDLWREAVSLGNYPKRGLTIPFAFERKVIRNLTRAANGTILDRFRLVGPFAVTPLVGELAGQLSAWYRPALGGLPTHGG